MMSFFYRICLTSLLAGTFVFASAAPNKTDNKGRKQGEWSKSHPNGKVMYKGQFRDDVPYGTFLRYHENGNLMSEQTYEQGGCSVVKMYGINGKDLLAEGKYKGKKKEGEWKFYSEGKITSLETFRDDIRHGLYKSFSKKGAVIEECNYIDGKIDGVQKQFLEDGSLYSELNYKNGVKDGVYKLYEGGAKPVIEGRYKNGKKDGEWVFYDEKGAVSETEKYKDGVLQNAKELKSGYSQTFDEREKKKGVLREPNEEFGVDVKVNQ